ncbi:MAG TPA: tetratricopeptide repeat protein [Paucimonas sp.]|nr:tetratricopeptide repeat protein [Paucimonas sp.]
MKIDKPLSLIDRIRLRLSTRLTRILLRYLPNDLAILSSLGDMELRLGDFARAERTYAASLDLHRNQPAIHLRRGIALEMLGRSTEALRCYSESIGLHPGFAEAIERRKRLVQAVAAGEGDDAPDAAQSAGAEACLAQGAEHFEAGRYEDALACYGRAIRQRPGFASALSHRGSTLYQMGMLEEALASYDAAIAADSGFAEAYRNKGVVLRRLGRHAESDECLDHALRLRPNDTVALLQHADRLLYALKVDEAIACLGQILAADPGNIEAHESMAFYKLIGGELEEGFRLYEWRHKKWNHFGFLEYGLPVWLGDEPIRGKTLLITHEQGWGDFIQFCRYVPLLEERGARVVIEAPEPLYALLRSLSGTAVIVERGSPLPECDFVCPVASLPLACGTTLVTIPSQPYLSADPEKSRAWSEKLGERKGLRIGLVWSGGLRPNQPAVWAVNERRNMPLSKLASLNLPGVEFFSLQKGEDGAAQLRAAEASSWDGPRIVDYMDEVDDFSDTAALIDNLDLVISVDTSTAHLAAAMGKPVWLLNRFDTCWRWMLGRADSPWYPTLTIFRQEAPGDWDSVVAAVRSRLQEMAAAHARGGASMPAQMVA